MYSLPSTSSRRAPQPLRKYSGTGAFARNGLETPPASDRFARSRYSRDFVQLSITCPPAGGLRRIIENRYTYDDADDPPARGFDSLCLHDWKPGLGGAAVSCQARYGGQRRDERNGRGPRRTESGG